LTITERATAPAPPLQHLDVDGARIAFWDTAAAPEYATTSDQPAVVLLHARSGSHRSWDRQLASLPAAGLRVLAFSRRGHEGTEHTTVGRGCADLLALLDAADVVRAHLVGHAAGGVWALDAALAHPHRVASLLLASTTFGLRDPWITAAIEGLRPGGFERLPPHVRELGPSYRATQPDGVRAWQALERTAMAGPFFLQEPDSAMNLTSARTSTVPTALLTGDADLYMPPALMAQVAEAAGWPAPEVVRDCGHCPHWEQPTDFNAAVVRHARANAP